jgi:hypothetical protein
LVAPPPRILGDQRVKKLQGICSPYNQYITHLLKPSISPTVITSYLLITISRKVGVCWIILGLILMTWAQLRAQFGKNWPLAGRRMTMKKKNSKDAMEKVGNTLKEVENLTELIEREKASVTVLLMAASGHSIVDTDDVCLIMRDSCERLEKMETSLGRISELVSSI